VRRQRRVSGMPRTDGTSPEPGGSGGVRRGKGLRGRTIAVTAAGGPTGAAVVASLAAAAAAGRGGPRRVVAVDGPREESSEPDETRPADPADETDETDERVDRRYCDIASPEVATQLAGADVVVHVAVPDDLAAALAESRQERRARAVRAVQAVATAAAAVGAEHLVVVTSAMVLGATADNPVPLPDDAPVAAAPDEGLVGDLLEVERVLALVPSVHPGLKLTVVRPAALVGPGVDTVITRHFEAPRLLVVRGATGELQFCHVDDLGAAITTVIGEGLTGPVTVGAEGALGPDDLERITGMRRLEVPQGLAFGTAERLRRVGVMPMPASDLAYVVHPWVVAGQRLRDAGWAPEYDNEACLTALLESVRGRHAVAGRRVDRRDAALGAAGAAVALVGTAAIVRQARSRHVRRRRPTLEP
jgi:nucleoside-diphosphate-sugar epimerase